MNKVISVDIPVGIGDLFYAKSVFDFALKNGYSQVNVGLATHLIDSYRAENKQKYYEFISDLAKLLFSSNGFNLKLKNTYGLQSIERIASNYNLTINKPKLSNILCSNESTIKEPYIVITTKVRQLNKKIFNEKNINTFFKCLNKLSNKYKIVILGEKNVEMNAEYSYYGSDYIYSIYNIIINNTNNANNIIDLSIPALGLTVTNIEDFKKDCNILHHAKYAINFGIGGNFAMASAVGYPICYREDDFHLADLIFNKTYDDCFVTKNWEFFIKKLSEI